jgi:hypothetical protein
VNRTGALATASIGSAVYVTNVLTVANGTLNSNGMLILKSDAANTARVAPVPMSGNINGNVVVERYIPARRAWRILGAPTGGMQTIQQGWQEGAAPNTNPNPGYGTHVTGGPVFGSPANGFDQNPGAATSIKSYTGTSWVAVPNTNATTVGNKALMLFVRGDRGIPISTTLVPPTPTTLRTMGPLNIGDHTFPVAASGFTAVGNPFASPINFATITRNNVQNNFYLWDPKMGGDFGVGAYVNISFNGVGYDVTPAAVSPESQYIQSGQGFLVVSTGVPGSITIKESDKSATPSTDVFRTIFNPKGFRITLHGVNQDNTLSLLDEAYTSYSSRFAAELDNFDAPKLENVEENLAISNFSDLLMVERRPIVTEDESIHLKLWNTTDRNYVFEFNPENLSSTGLQAYIVDKFLGTTTPVDMNRISQVYFSVTSNTASANPDRFRIVFSLGKAKPAASETMIRVYPNPVVNGNVTLDFMNLEKGTYQVRILNTIGQVVYRKDVFHAGGSAVQKLSPGRQLAKGLYEVQVSGNNYRSTTKLVSQ